MRTLLIDNYDSFTYNLFQLLAEVNGEEPTVIRNDEASWSALSRLDFDNVVLSPGPGRPERERDFGVCAAAIRHSRVPLLGVCLGHQGIGWAHGARIVAAPEPMHGRLSAVSHGGSPLFAGIPRELSAVRYHSLCVEQPLPEALEPLAWSDDGVLMALAHRSRPQWGVQFHPESICAEHGRRLLVNFRDITAALGGSRREGAAAVATRQQASGRATDERPPAASGALTLLVRRLGTLHDPERAFVHLYGNRPDAFWLDSSRVGERARFSFIGAADGPLAATISYDVGRREVTVRRSGGTQVLRESIFDYMSREMRRLHCPAGELPFDFNCGFVGYLGYELKAECGASSAHESSTPDAALVFADRLIAFDHIEGSTYVLCVSERGSEAEGERWVGETSGRLAVLPPPAAATYATAPERGAGREPVEPSLSRSREQYLQDIVECKRLLAEGETYEVCLTDRIRVPAAPDPLGLYRSLRRVNPAPFSAFLRVRGVAVLSSSPERLVRVGRDRRVEARPIKGTSPRGETSAEDERLAERLQSDEKNRAENLMIVDLLRNDLGSVCEVGSVHVPHLMEVESYETVHQLVSTVRGVLRAELQAPDCIRACFPGGSMTGAPKLRTMEILDELEGEARGVYSGAIGYLGLSGGCDMSVVIRTLVVDGSSTSLGVGGAIVMQSDPQEELDEMLLKASAPMRAIDPDICAQTALTQDAVG